MNTNASVSVVQIETSLQRKLEDLTNELAYINHFPERFDNLDRAARKAAVIQAIKYTRWLLATHWAAPIEQLQLQEISPCSTASA